jgi:hypothetical protein
MSPARLRWAAGLSCACRQRLRGPRNLSLFLPMSPVAPAEVSVGTAAKCGDAQGQFSGRRTLCAHQHFLQPLCDDWSRSAASFSISGPQILARDRM